MPQELCATITVTALGPQETLVVAHGLCDWKGALAPDLVLATKPSPISVVSADATNVTFHNDGDFPETVTFYIHAHHSIQGHDGQHLAEGRRFAGTLWSALAPVTIADTAVETSQLSVTAQGNQTLAANVFTLGRQMRIETRGIISSGNAQSATFRIKLGSYTLISSLGTLPNNLSDAYIESLFDIICYESGGTGRIRGTGRTFLGPSGGVGTAAMRPLLMAADQVLDTRLAMKVDYTYQWTNAAAGNTVTIVSASVRTLN